MSSIPAVVAYKQHCQKLSNEVEKLSSLKKFDLKSIDGKIISSILEEMQKEIKLAQAAQEQFKKLKADYEAGCLGSLKGGCFVIVLKASTLLTWGATGTSSLFWALTADNDNTTFRYTAAVCGCIAVGLSGISFLAQRVHNRVKNAVKTLEEVSKKELEHAKRIQDFLPPLRDLIRTRHLESFEACLAQLRLFPPGEFKDKFGTSEEWISFLLKMIDKENPVFKQIEEIERVYELAKNLEWETRTTLPHPMPKPFNHSIAPVLTSAPRKLPEGTLFSRERSIDDLPNISDSITGKTESKRGDDSPDPALHRTISRSPGSLTLIADPELFKGERKTFDSPFERPLERQNTQFSENGELELSTPHHTQDVPTSLEHSISISYQMKFAELQKMLGLPITYFEWNGRRLTHELTKDYSKSRPTSSDFHTITINS